MGISSNIKYSNWSTARFPIGKAVIMSDGVGICAIYAGNELAAVPAYPGKADRPDRLTELAASQLSEYFAGVRRVFDVPLSLTGTDFQMSVYQALIDIPYGEVMTYGGLAGYIGRPGAARAVGSACGSNPVPLIVPCHRVIGSSGALTGFGLGLDIKSQLLELEGWKK